MGAAASPGLSAAIGRASLNEISDALSTLSPASREKLDEAMHAALATQNESTCPAHRASPGGGPGGVSGEASGKDATDAVQEADVITLVLNVEDLAGSVQGPFLIERRETVSHLKGRLEVKEGAMPELVWNGSRLKDVLTMQELEVPSGTIFQVVYKDMEQVQNEQEHNAAKSIQSFARFRGRKSK
eukprot:gnl/TRDRNA2_/TRDRNA2_195292_c0_seq1.p1 gnl/TRDRNA2_/TRDRNA2_195292_c0~~gnl/TRDRNA2_/TRDRNA2_195292_c0_seq1.p1  ORF type:complete len:186 (+),score=34.51 gnl/TRDRNA2_/TRDRNA2_195292_c0_seq1:48-605(+)